MLDSILNCIDENIRTGLINERALHHYLYELQDFAERIEEMLNDVDRALEKTKKIGINKELINGLENIKNSIYDSYKQFVNITYHEDLEYRALLDNDKLQNLGEIIYKFIISLNSLKKIFSDIGEEILRSSEAVAFKGRTSLLSQEAFKELLIEDKNVSEVLRASYDLYSGLKELPSKSKSLCDPEANYISEMLLASLREGLWAYKLLEILTGFKSVSGEPTTEYVLFNYGDKESRDLSIDELFYRYPPFEPIAKAINSNVVGNYVWFIRCENARLNIDEAHKYGEVVDGDIIDRGSHIKIERIEPVDVLSLNNGEAIVKLHVGEKKQQKIVFIKYGSQKLKRELRRLGYKLNATQIEELQRRYESEIRESRSKIRATYKVSNLSYVWYCSIGFGMSTDPYDYRDCPFRNECLFGKALRVKRCLYWSNKRRIFPRVFPTVKRNLRKRNLKEDSLIGFIKIVYDYGVPLDEIYSGVRWYMPTDYGDGISVSAVFKKTIVKELPKTNVVGLSIPLSLVRALISELLDENITPKPSVRLSSSLEVTIDKLLYSKFFIWVKTHEGTDQFRLFQKGKNKLIKEYLEFINQIKNSMNGIIDYCVELFSHTLAHLFYTYLSRKLEIDLEHLIYLYKIDKEKDQLLILVAENSPHGVINIVEHIKRKFNNLENMVREFCAEILSYLERHIEEIDRSRDETRRMFSQAKGSISKHVAELNEYYRELVENGIVLDLYSFILHMILSSVNKRKEVTNEYLKLGALIKDYLDVYYCVDGCSSCTLLENKCINALTQNLMISRALTYWILKILIKGESFRGTGKISGVTLLNQSRHKIFAVSPYLDEDGVNTLINLARRNVKVTLVTRHEVVEKFGDILKKQGIEVWIQQSPRHDKMYIIDDEILVESSWNLSSFSSVNHFTIKIRPMLLKSLEDQILSTCKRAV